MFRQRGDYGMESGEKRSAKISAGTKEEIQ